jgi:Mg/Co/Ni transporter MgtE
MVADGGAINTREFTVRASDDLRRVAALFLETAADSLPCVDGDGHVVGRITRAAVATRLGGPLPR